MEDASIIITEYSNFILVPFKEDPAMCPTFNPSTVPSPTPNSGWPYTNPVDYTAEFEARKLEMQKAKRKKR